MRLRRNILWTAVGSISFMLCSGVLAEPQDKLAELSASGLLSEAAEYLSTENYGAALPCLTNYLGRMKETDDDRVTALKQSVRLKLGKVLAYLEDYLSAAEYLKQYTETLPCYRPREAFKLLALTLYESEQYELCIAAATNALSNPLPKGLRRQSERTQPDELSKEEMAGFTARQIKRIEIQAEEAGESLSRAISDKVPDAEPDYTAEELVFLQMTLAEAYSKLENWEASIEPYKFVIEHAAAEDRKGYAIMQLVNALIALEQFDEAATFVVKLYHTDARYDIRVNANDFDEVEKFLLNRFVVPKYTALFKIP